MTTCVALRHVPFESLGALGPLLDERGAKTEVVDVPLGLGEPSIHSLWRIDHFEMDVWSAARDTALHNICVERVVLCIEDVYWPPAPRLRRAKALQGAF